MFFITFNVNEMSHSDANDCNHFVGYLHNERWNDACGWYADVCFLRELLQRRVPV